MRNDVDESARRLGIASGSAVAVLGLSYACVLMAGLFTLPSSDADIQQPWLALLEVLIIAIAPTMVLLTVSLYAQSSEGRKPFALASVLFMSMAAATTSVVHFTILTLSHQAAFANERWARLAFAFKWPSISYALDILAWDIFFPIAALFAAATVEGGGLAGLVRALLFGSAVLSFIGLLGVALANMQVRNIGIIGYAVLFPIAAGAFAKMMATDAAAGPPES
jgi:hypothetical protein